VGLFYYPLAGLYMGAERQRPVIKGEAKYLPGFIMNIKVIKTANDAELALTGGGYAVTDVTVYIDERLPKRLQTSIIIHEIIECYLPSLPHDKIEDLTELISEALDE
jgi:hypothetical protein